MKLNATEQMILEAAERVAGVKDRNTRAHAFVSALTIQLDEVGQGRLARRVWATVFRGESTQEAADQAEIAALQKKLADLEAHLAGQVTP
jgi:hypothetical protein